MATSYMDFNLSPQDRVQMAQNALRSKNYAGSSGYWADGTQAAKPGLGMPGDADRNAIRSQFGLAPTPGSSIRYAPSWNNATNPWNNTTGNGLNGWATPPAPTGNPFQTLNNVKSPAIQSSINNTLSAVNNQTYNPAVNPNTLHTNTKNPALESGINAFIQNLNSYTAPRDFTKSGNFQAGINNAYGQANQDSGTNRASFADFTKLFDSQTPGAQANTTQENNAIGSVYGSASDPNSLHGQLNKIASDRAAAVNLSANRALDRVARNSAFGIMQNGGSSYINQQALDNAAGIYADEARQQADLARNNLQYVQGQQASLSNLRNQNLGFLANRSLQPVNALNALNNSENSRLAGIGAADLSNNIYATPQEQAAQRAALLASLGSASANNNIYTLDSQQNYLGRQLGLLNQVQGLNAANNFYGLDKQYTPNYDGYTNYGLGSSGYSAGPQRNNSYLPTYPQGTYPPAPQASPNPYHDTPWYPGSPGSNPSGAYNNTPYYNPNPGVAAAGARPGGNWGLSKGGNVSPWDADYFNQ